MRIMSRIHSLMLRILIFHDVQSEKLFEIARFLCNTNTVNYVYLKYRYINPTWVFQEYLPENWILYEKNPRGISKRTNDAGKVLPSIFAIDRLSNPNDRPRSMIVVPLATCSWRFSVLRVRIIQSVSSFGFCPAYSRLRRYFMESNGCMWS